MDRCSVGGWTDGLMDGPVDRWIDGQMTRWNIQREVKHQDFTADYLDSGFVIQGCSGKGRIVLGKRLSCV